MLPDNLVPPSVAGGTEAGGTLTCSPGAWSGTPPPKYSYQWLRDYVDIPGATSASYTTTANDVGHVFYCRVTAANAAGWASVSSAPVRIVAAPVVAPPVVAPPVIAPPVVVPPDRVPPNVFGFVLSPRSFRPAGRGPSVLTGSNIGAKVSYRLSEDASVTFTVEQALGGRRKGKSCLPDTRARRRLPRCTRYVRVRGSFKHAGHKGTNSLRFSGRLANRSLKPGSYRLIATARDRPGNSSKPARASFAIRR